MGQKTSSCIYIEIATDYTVNEGNMQLIYGGGGLEDIGKNGSSILDAG